MPLGDLSYDNFNGLHPNRAVLSDNLARVTLMRGSGDLDTASTSNIGGTLKFDTRDPAPNAAIVTAVGLGSKGATRVFARGETGEVLEGLTAYISGARLDAPNWKGKGRERSWQVNTKVVWNIDAATQVKAFLTLSDLAADDYIDMSRATLSRYGYKWDYLRGDFASAAEIARLYQANPAGDCGTNPYPRGIACVDDSYYDGYGLRHDQIGYVKLDRRIGADWTVSLQPYLHHNRGEGTWWFPYSGTPGGAPLAVRSSGYRIRRHGVIATLAGTVGQHQFRLGGWLEDNRNRRWRALYALAADGSNYGPRAWSAPADRLFTYFDYQLYARTRTAFIQDRWQLSEALRIEAGARAVRLSVTNRTLEGGPVVNGRIVSSDAFLPQVGATLQLRGGFELFGNYSENMRAFGQAPFGTDQTGFDLVKATLRPETARTVEGGMRFHRGGLEAALAGYRIDFRHRLAFTRPCAAIATCASVPTDVGAVRTTGVELTATWRPVPAWSLYAAWSLSDARSLDDIHDGDGTLVVATAGKVTVNTPRHIASAEASYDDGTRFLRLTANYQGRRFYSYSNDSSIGGRVLFDLAASVRLPHGVELQANVTNLFDTRYVGTIGESTFPDTDTDGSFRSMMPGSPRQFFLTLKHDLS